MFRFWCLRIYKPLLNRMSFSDSNMREFAEMIYRSLDNISENSGIANESAVIRLLENNMTREVLDFYKKFMPYLGDMDTIYKRRSGLEEIKKAYSADKTERDQPMLFSLDDPAQWKTQKSAPESIPVLLKNFEETAVTYSMLKKSAVETLICSYSKKYGKTPTCAADIFECFGLPPEKLTDPLTGNSFFNDSSLHSGDMNGQ